MEKALPPGPSASSLSQPVASVTSHSPLGLFSGVSQQNSDRTLQDGGEERRGYDSEMLCACEELWKNDSNLQQLTCPKT